MLYEGTVYDTPLFGVAALPEVHCKQRFLLQSVTTLASHDVVTNYTGTIRRSSSFFVATSRVVSTKFYATLGSKGPEEAVEALAVESSKFLFPTCARWCMRSPTFLRVCCNREGTKYNLPAEFETSGTSKIKNSLPEDSPKLLFTVCNSETVYYSTVQ